MIKILAPIDKVGEITQLHRVGVKEFYCGYIPKDWIEKYNKNLTKTGQWHNFQISINKRENMQTNITNFDSIKKIVEEASRHMVPIFLTLNSFYYIKDMYNYLHEYIRKMVEIGISGLILADIGLLQYVKTNYPKMEIILSCVTPIRNIWAKQLFAEMGVKRITFPRHITIEEIESITHSYPDLEYECFIMGTTKCLYGNENCMTIHSAGRFCQENQWEYEYLFTAGSQPSYREIENLFANEQAFIRWVNTYPSRSTMRNGWRNIECGVCSIPDLINRTNISSLKLEGRGLGLVGKFRMIRIINRAIKMTKEGACKEDLRLYIQDTLPDPELCQKRLRCYPY